MVPRRGLGTRACSEPREGGLGSHCNPFWGQGSCEGVGSAQTGSFGDPSGMSRAWGAPERWVLVGSRLARVSKSKTAQLEPLAPGGSGSIPLSVFFKLGPAPAVQVGARRRARTLHPKAEQPRQRKGYGTGGAPGASWTYLRIPEGGRCGEPEGRALMEAGVASGARGGEVKGMEWRTVALSLYSSRA